jgi:hypothetical protein
MDEMGTRHSGQYLRELAGNFPSLNKFGPASGLAPVKGATWKYKKCTAVHCNEYPLYVFQKKELRGLSPNFNIHVFVSDFLLSQDRSTYFPAAE